MSINVNIDKLRSYANILSNSTFNGLVRDGDFDYLKAKINKYDKKFAKHNGLSYQEYFSHIFNSLKVNYRNEYIYKNLITKKILLGRHNLNTTVALNEFRINKSIADLVLINGTSKVFEIKTELDNSQRLISQIDDYKKVFKEIYLVTHYSLKDKYSDIIGNEIGLIVLTKNFSLQTIRQPKINTTIDNLSILKCLRKQEYSNIIISYFGSLPQVSDFKFYNACKELFLKIPSDILHDLMMQELKRRTVKEKEILASPAVPDELKHICYCLDFTKSEYKVLNSVLREKILI
ncbi:MAG: sce7726 family protein [Bacteroidales bacterium]|nr:sce7726 family protein [Bacteroidales bacterium]